MFLLSQLREEQPFAVTTLTQAIEGERRHHAYLFAGPLEASANNLVMAMAGSLLCTDRRGSDACGTCAGCRKLAGKNHPDLVHLQPDEKGNLSIDTIRQLANRLSLRATEADTKIAIIEHADAMKPPAQNALLKTLEEPPGPTCFLLTTTRIRTLLPTIRSRCQTVRLAPKKRAGAWRVLAEAGIDPEIAQRLAALVGPDVDRAQELVDKGAGEIIAALSGILTLDVPIPTIMNAAADLGGDKERADLAFALLEVDIRDRLARAHGALGASYSEQAGTDLPVSHLCNGAAQLQTIRRYQAVNLNRTMALETVLLAVTGHVTPTRSMA